MEIDTAIELPVDAYIGIEKDTDIKDDGTCEVEDAFTPDDISCYL